MTGKPDQNDGATPEPANENDGVAATPSDKDAKAAEATAADAPAAAPKEGKAAEGDPEALAHEVAELKSRLLHTRADMENLRRRTEREIAAARKYAASNFAREALTLGDNLQRALDAVPPAMRESADSGVTALIEGVEVTARSFDQILQKFGIERIEAVGKKFDPDRHQAMMEVEDADAEPGSVAAEIQVGYAIGERVLRPAFVSVVRKPKAAKGDKDAAGKPGADASGNDTAA